MGASDQVLVETLTSVVDALVAGRRGEAQAHLDLIRVLQEPRATRPSLRTSLVASIFQRDAFTCRYCGLRTIPSIVLRLVSCLYPVDFPYDPHWKHAHPAYWKITTSVDHVEAGSSGGDWLDPVNLVTACWQCNQTKGNVSLDHGGLSLNPPTPGDWDGLTGVYPTLWEIAGRPQPATHRPWLRAFSI